MRFLLLLVALLAARAAAAPLKIVATTTLIADVARQVAGPEQPVESLMPVDSDPHAFNATPRDVVRLAGADLVLVNGLGLESFLGDLLSVAGSSRVVVVSRTIKPRALAQEQAHGPQDGGEDPHVWFDPILVQAWTRVIGEELAARLPAQAEAIRARVAAYDRKLQELDDWARGRLAGIPPARRRLVTDHDAFGYFADRYGLTVVGCVLPGFSSSAEASVRDLARLHDVMRTAAVRTIFVEQAGNPAVSRRLGEAVGAELVALPTCSLSAADGPAATYEAFFRHVVNSVAQGLER